MVKAAAEIPGTRFVVRKDRLIRAAYLRNLIRSRNLKKLKQETCIGICLFLSVLSIFVILGAVYILSDMFDYQRKILIYPYGIVIFMFAVMALFTMLVFILEIRDI